MLYALKQHFCLGFYHNTSSQLITENPEHTLDHGSLCARLLLIRGRCHLVVDKCMYENTCCKKRQLTIQIIPNKRTLQSDSDRDSSTLKNKSKHKTNSTISYIYTPRSITFSALVHTIMTSHPSIASSPSLPYSCSLPQMTLFVTKFTNNPVT